MNPTNKIILKIKAKLRMRSRLENLVTLRDMKKIFDEHMMESMQK